MSVCMLQLRRDTRAVTAVEFAIISLPLVTLMFSGMDVAYQGYATAVLQGTTSAAARKATLENATTANIETFVRNQLKQIASGANVQISAQSFLQYSKIGKPERLQTDVNGNGQYDANNGPGNPPDCFYDDNRSNTYDTASQGKSGIGTAEDVVRYNVSISYKRLTPVAKFIGLSDPVTISRTTFLRNEPYAGIVDPPVRCGV